MKKAEPRTVREAGPDKAVPDHGQKSPAPAADKDRAHEPMEMEVELEMDM